MSLRHTFAFTALLAFTFLKAQVHLPHCINPVFAPDDSANIMAVSTYSDTSNLFVSSGFQVGDIVPDFNLPDTNYNNVKLSNILDEGKPVMLISVSYSCPASRESMQITLPNLVNQFGSEVNFVLVYIVEAHPVYPDWSPYFDTVNTTQQNYQDTILIHQETRYFQREHFAKVFHTRFHPDARIAIDDYNNDYWHTFGPAPNNAYLIKPNGEIFKKYGWFVQSQNTEIHDIDQLIAMLSVNESAPNITTNVYPNPGNDFVQIESGLHEGWTLEVYDETGQVVRHIEHINSESFRLDCSGLRSGMYFIRIPEANTIIRENIIAGN